MTKPATVFGDWATDPSANVAAIPAAIRSMGYGNGTTARPDYENQLYAEMGEWLVYLGGDAVEDWFAEAVDTAAESAVIMGVKDTASNVKVGFLPGEAGAMNGGGALVFLRADDAIANDFSSIYVRHSGAGAADHTILYLQADHHASARVVFRVEGGTVTEHADPSTHIRYAYDATGIAVELNYDPFVGGWMSLGTSPNLEVTGTGIARASGTSIATCTYRIPLREWNQKNVTDGQVSGDIWRLNTITANVATASASDTVTVDLRRVARDSSSDASVVSITRSAAGGFVDVFDSTGWDIDPAYTYYLELTLDRSSPTPADAQIKYLSLECTKYGVE